MTDNPKNLQPGRRVFRCGGNPPVDCSELLAIKDSDFKGDPKFPHFETVCPKCGNRVIHEAHTLEQIEQTSIQDQELMAKGRGA
jgi:hypothetical protein